MVMQILCRCCSNAEQASTYKTECVMHGVVAVAFGNFRVAVTCGFNFFCRDYNLHTSP